MEETGGATAYGVSLSGGGFDFYKFIRQPQTIVRVLSWVSELWVSGSSCREAHVVRRSSEVEIRHKGTFRNRCALPGASAEDLDRVHVFVLDRTTGYYMQRVRGASCCRQLACDSSSVTAQVNAAVVRGQKAEKRQTRTEICWKSEVPSPNVM